MKISLPVKVGFLIILAFVLASAAGFLIYNNLSSIVSSVQVKSRPDLRLLLIRDVSADLDKAESSVRMYRLTQKQKDIKPYYYVIDGIDEKIDSLKSASDHDTALLAQIDTISSLIEDNLIVWNNMLDLYYTDSLDIYIRTLTAKIAVGTLNKKKPEKNILKRVFSRKALRDEARQQQEQQQQELISDLNKIEKQDSLENTLLLQTETKLATTGNEIRNRLYILISRMEHELISSIAENSKMADQLAMKTYRSLVLFAAFGALLVLSVLLVVIRYVRKTREYQNALEKSKEETEQLSKTKELFMANMSHELRTPVNAIYGFAEQLEHESLNESSLKMLGIIKSASNHLVQIVNDILDFSRLQNAKIELEKNHFFLQALFDNLQSLLAKNASENNSHLYYTISDTVPKALFGDSYRLQQILLNLIGNAVKFTANGEICFSANVMNVSRDSLDLVITVRDSGIGISQEMQSRVFDDFTQAEAGTSRKFGGTGLGLSIVKKLVVLHKGVISLQSEVGKGTAITCILPYKAGDIRQVHETSETFTVPDMLKDKAVLIVDDEDYNRMLFKTIFTRWQIAFAEAGDGQKAIEKISSGHYDLVFMDTRMPGMDGIEAVKFIRNNLGKSKEQLLIIGTSATHSVEDMKTYHALGMNAFLPKPFTEKQLLKIIVSVLKNSHESIETDIKQEDHNRTSLVVPVMDVPGTQVNLTSLYHLANNDISFIKQLLVTFIESTEEGLNGMQQAIDSSDLDTVHEIAHKISSPCRHLGADNLYAHLKLIEDQARNNKNIGILAKLSEDSNREFLEIKIGLQKHLEKI